MFVCASLASAKKITIFSCCSCSNSNRNNSKTHDDESNSSSSSSSNSSSNINIDACMDLNTCPLSILKCSFMGGREGGRASEKRRDEEEDKALEQIK